VGKVSKKEYAVTIRNIKYFFEGKKGKLLTILQKEMKIAIRDERFEDAAKIRNQIFALEHIRDVSLIKRESIQGDRTVLESGHAIASAFRMEAYDIAHMGGKNMVGVMVVMEDGEFNKNEYRKFIIRGFDSSNDTGALKEILSRRLGHGEWRPADLVVIDGGQAQLNVAVQVLADAKSKSNLVSVVKDEKHKAREIMGDPKAADVYKNDIIKLNAEAHRYAIAFHKKRRGDSFLPQR
jgi:excinuclease UvrABC nuclease subunit